MRHLINISNKKSAEFTEKQKEGFETITDIEFPNVDPNLDTSEVEEKYVIPLIAEVGNTLTRLEDEYGRGNFETCIMLMGEFTVCYLLRDFLMKNPMDDKFTFLIPTTERKVVEKTKEDGTVEKTSIFEFVKYRTI